MLEINFLMSPRALFMAIRSSNFRARTQSGLKNYYVKSSLSLLMKYYHSSSLYNTPEDEEE
jgi:hypothetical protein